MGGDIIGERLRMTVNGQSGRRRRAVRIPGCYTFVRHLGKMGPPSSLLFLTVVGNGGWGGRAGERIVSEKTRERIKKSVKVIIVIISINWHQTRVLPFIKEREVKESWQHREKKKTDTEDKRWRENGACRTERTWGPFIPPVCESKTC